VEVRYCEDTRPRSQLEAAHHQHGVLCEHPRRAAAIVSLHTFWEWEVKEEKLRTQDTPEV